MDKKRIFILGSTGSIGRQAIEVILANKELYELDAITANTNATFLVEQAIQTMPNAVIIHDTSQYDFVKDKLKHLPIKVFAGEQSVVDYMDVSDCHIVLAATMGFAGLLPVIKAIEKHKRIALANKETLVVAGELIKNLVEKNNVDIIPVDSEHSAIFQCLVGENLDSVEKLILTASGGPFYKKSTDELSRVTAKEALQHPTWNMGNKITIDSSTLMNKGLEVIEAYWLFGIPSEQIDVVIHPSSIVHSLVQFIDGSYKAQLGLPDMRIPIQYAFSFPDRHANPFPKSMITEIPKLEFFKPDVEKFPCLLLAYDAIKQGGNMPCMLNAANEIAVNAFLENKIQFYDIPHIIEKTMSSLSFIKHPNMQQIIETDKESRIFATSFI